MKSEWRVTSNLINGQKLYGVYRLLDMDEVDHSGNREHLDVWVADRCIAEKLAERYNMKEESGC